MIIKNENALKAKKGKLKLLVIDKKFWILPGLWSKVKTPYWFNDSGATLQRLN